ncbi:integrase-recombinase protein : Marine sediment metagenome DNA, contig: S06H3_L02821 (Fragment) OS=marine sediment metagenome GN=S06H3_17168 PE=4 SV=1: Phage_integrase [Gemmataceae bacterium]
MPKPFKLFSTRPLPADADVLDHEGKPHVRVKDRGRSILCSLTKDGRGYLRPSKCWYFDLRSANGTVKRTKGFADLKATEQLAAELERKASRVRVGLIDPAEEHARRPLAEHLKDYAAYLDAKGNVSEHNKATVAKVSAIMAACRFVYPADLDAAKVSAFLADLRRPSRVVALPPGDVFSSSAAAKLLGLTPDAVRRFVARHRLPTVGTGKNRRLPRATVQHIAEQGAKGAGPTTANRYTVAIRGFARWLVKLKRIGSDPLDSLTLVNTAVDVRRGRRELTTGELQALLTATRASDRTFRGLGGNDRFHLYLTASGTGFRANALANLTPADFDLSPDGPTVTLPARFAKNRKTKVQPVPADVAEVLRQYLAGKPEGVPVWGGTWAKERRGAEMLRADLEAVGIPYAVEGPDGPEYADFHALRHTYLTMLGRNGVDLRTAQELAGHSTPLLTARYSHRRLYDLAGAVDKLPSLVPVSSSPQNQALRATGTTGAKPDDSVRLGVVPGVVTRGIAGHQLAPSGNLQFVEGGRAGVTKALEMQGPALIGTGPRRSAEVRPEGIEPSTTRLKVSCSTD